MFTNKQSQVVLRFSTLILVFVGGAIAIGIEKPVGSISGRIAIEEKGFDLSSYDIKKNKVYALAVGPSGGDIVERGVWVKPDGTFEINQLPVGEYSLTVRATGFATTDQQGIFVDDAKTVALKEPVHLAILEPSVNIASNTRVFTSKEIPHFWLNASGSDQATVKIYRKDILSLLKKSRQKDGLDFSSDLTLYKPYQKKDGPLYQEEKPLQTLSRKLERDYQDWSHAEFKLNKPLPAGEYVLVAEVKNLKDHKDWNVMWFSVSDLGLIVKQAPEKTLVRAIDLNTLKPLSNVAVQLMDRDSQTLSTLNLGKTDQDGFATFPIAARKKNENNYYVLAMGSLGLNRAFGGVSFWNDVRDNYQTYFYTERPIYRLGQTVYFKGLSRLKTANGFKTPKAGLPVKVIIEDPDNNKLWEGKLGLNGHGTFNGVYEIPKDGKTGAYQVTLTYPDGTDAYERFEVAQYRKPEYQVEVMPLKARITAGTKARARIRATYYFGAPVGNARIRYTIYANTDWSARFGLMPRPDYYGYFDDWESDESEYADTSYSGDLIAQGYAQTDATGEALIEFDTPPVKINQNEPYSTDYLDRQYTVQAEVTDLSRIAVIGSGKQAVSAGDFALFVQPEHAVSKAGEAVKALVTAVDYQGKAIANQSVSVALMRWNWDRVQQEYRGTSVLGTVSATTDANGKALVTLPTTDRYFTDNYFLTAQTADRHNHTIYDQASVWIASGNNPYIRDGQSAQQEAFSVKLDKKVYRPGEIAKALITAPVSGKENGQVIVAVESTKIHTSQVLPMNATAKLIEIPLTDAYAPNVYVTATFVGPKHQFYNQSEIAMVSPESHFLNLSVTPDKPKYKPGDQATYTIKASYPNGKPAANTEVSLGVVDESIYAIRPESAGDIRRFFYNKLYNSVVTLSSFPEEYSAGPDKIEPKVRKDFRDVAAWQPTLITNAQGLAKTTIKLPDNLTTWRATVRGINQQTDVGSAISTVVSTQDLIVRLALPRFFTQHDQGQLTAIVHNYTEQPQKVALTLNTTGQFETKQALVQHLTVKPDGAERYGWPVDVVNPGEAVIDIKAVGDTAGDAMELKVPVRPLAIEISEAKAGLLKGDAESITLPFKIPASTDPKLAQLLVSVAASSIGPVLGSFDSLIDYPYGCTEQTMSRLIPSVIAFELSRKLQVPISAAQRKKFDEVATKSLGKLKDYHNGDGGWGWWQYADSDAYLTAYVMEGLHLLENSGYGFNASSLPDGWKKDGVHWLKKSSEKLTAQLSDPKLASDRFVQTERLIDLAYMQYVLSLYGEKTDAGTRKFLTDKIPASPPEALAYSVLAFHTQKENKAAEQAYAALNHLAETAAGMKNWDHTDALAKKLNWKEVDYTYRFTGIESTALGLRAALAMENDPEATSSIEQWLILQRGKDGWANTKTTALVLRTMMEKAIASGKAGATDFSVTSNLWESAKQFTASNLYAPEQNTTVTLDSLKDESVNLQKTGSGQLYYSALLKYLLPLKPGDTIPQKAMPEGLKISRQFFRIHAEPVGPEGTLRFKTDRITDNKVRAGETVVMKVLVESPTALPYVIVDTALPSGGEVVSNDPRENLLEHDENQLAGDWGNWWWAHQDILDDRVVMFANSLPAGKSEFYALVRMELPGTFRMNPVKLEGMYSQRVKAYSSLDSIQVTE
jgi:uncharacterized protein YfaS (alpha-2-macroglobulin family)